MACRLRPLLNSHGTTHIACAKYVQEIIRDNQAKIFRQIIKGNLMSAKLAHTLLTNITGSYENV
jgi:hypothetical protein